MPKILAILSKKLKEGANHMQEAIAETLGLMAYFVVTKVGTMATENINVSQSQEA